MSDTLEVAGRRYRVRADVPFNDAQDLAILVGHAAVIPGAAITAAFHRTECVAYIATREADRAPAGFDFDDFAVAVHPDHRGIGLLHALDAWNMARRPARARITSDRVTHPSVIRALRARADRCHMEQHGRTFHFVKAGS